MANTLMAFYSRRELAAHAAELYHASIISLLAPLQVAAWRLLGLEDGADRVQLTAAVSGIAMYFDPAEQANAECGNEAHVRA